MTACRISTAMERYLEREPQNQEVLMESIQMFADAVATGISTHLASICKSNSQ